MRQWGDDYVAQKVAEIVLGEGQGEGQGQHGGW